MREEESTTAEHPDMLLAFDAKPIVPVGVGGPAGVTVAVNVTVWPWVEGFWLETTVVVEGIPLPGSTTCDRLPLLPR
jgi:hypothetical protein